MCKKSQKNPNNVKNSDILKTTKEGAYLHARYTITEPSPLQLQQIIYRSGKNVKDNKYVYETI